MFDLEKSIVEWRQQMLAAGIKTPVPLEELEIHLREDIEQQIQLGANPQQAFENSVQQIGHAEELKGEFKKICGTKWCNSKWAKWILQLPQWSLLLWGVTGLVATWILSLVMPYPRLHQSWTLWLPNYVTFTTFTISGLVIGFARWHTKWTLLWISSIGLIGTVIANLVCRFVFHRSDWVSLFLQREDLSWFWFYTNWMIFIIMGLPFGLSNWTLWLNKLLGRLDIKQI